VGWHASDPATPYLSLLARRPGFTTADLDTALYQNRAVVKHLAMRRTLWVVTAADLPLVQSGASDRVASDQARRLIADAENAGVTVDGTRWLAAAAEAVHRYLDEHGEAGSAELRSALPELAGTFDPAPGKRWGGATALAPRVLTVLGARGELIRGPNDGAWTASRHRWTRAAHWLEGAGSEWDPEPAYDELVRRWLRTFGPATLADIKWWFGSTLSATRRALAGVRATEVDLDGESGWALPDDLDPATEPAPWAALLPGLDVATMGWAARAWYLGEHGGQVFDRNGNAGPTAWCNGRVVGGWRHGQDGTVHLQLLEDPGRDGRKALERKATELTEWLGDVRIKPRFPSPLAKSATG
jgi:Winged helix DNA-binding domain